MTLRFAIPNAGLVIEGEDLFSLLDQYSQSGVGGSRDWLEGHIKRSISALEGAPPSAPLSST